MKADDEQAMPLPRFWDIVERSRRDDEEEFLEALGKELRRLPPDQILAFDARLEQLLAECYRWDVWGAAYCLQGGCSDDGFLYFRCWLISQGRHAYETALANPDSLADYADEDDEARERELFLYAPVEAWQDVTG